MHGGSIYWERDPIKRERVKKQRDRERRGRDREEERKNDQGSATAMLLSEGTQALELDRPGFPVLAWPLPTWDMLGRKYLCDVTSSLLGRNTGHFCLACQDALRYGCE